MGATFRSLRLQWDQVLYASGYILEWKRIDENDFTSHEISNGATTQYTMINLSPDTEYNIRIKSLNSAQQSEYSDVGTVSTAELPTPQNLHAEPLVESLKISWNPPLDANGISGYILTWQAVADLDQGRVNQSQPTTRVLDLATNNYWITDIAGEYKVSIATYFGDYTGPNLHVMASALDAPPDEEVDEEVTQTPAPDADGFQLRLLEREVEVTWNAMSPDLIDGYHLAWYLEGGDAAVNYGLDDEIDKSATSKVIPFGANLYPGKSYRFELRSHVNSIHSEKVTKNIYIPPLPVPQNLTVDTSVVNQFSVSWDPPASGDIPFDGYILTWKLSTTVDTIPQHAVLDTSTTNYTVTDIDGTFDISVSTSLGNIHGQAITTLATARRAEATIVDRPNDFVPSPSNVRLSWVDNAVKAEWDPPETERVDNYFLVWHLVGGNPDVDFGTLEHRNVHNDININTLTADYNFVPGRYYNFKLISKWGVGSSSPIIQPFYIPSDNTSIPTPTNVHTVINGSRLAVSWDALPADQFDIYYLVWYKYFGNNSSKDAEISFTSVPNNETNYNIPDLEPGQTYKISLAAQRGYSYGNSVIKSIFMKSLPKPEGLIATWDESNARAVLHWYPMATAQLEEFDTFELDMFELESGSITGLIHQNSLANTAISTSVNQLIPGRSYQIRLRTKRGEAYSDAQQAVFEIPSDVASDSLQSGDRIQAPKLLDQPRFSHARTGDHHITLAWAPIEQADAYRLYWNPGQTVAQDNYQQFVDLTAADTQWTIDGLQNHRQYSFVVQAMFKHLKSAVSETVTLMPLQPLNDTGITWAISPEDLAPMSCDQESASNQDCFVGRDASFNDDSDGHAGFDFTRLYADGSQYAGSGDFALEPWACVLDNQTGLIWEVKRNDGGLHDASQTYRWGGIGASAYDRASRVGDYFDDWTELVSDRNGLLICGQDQWRVPTATEMQGLVDRGLSSHALDRQFFPHEMPTVWTATFDASDLANAWFFDLSLSGQAKRANRADFHGVRLVSSLKPSDQTDPWSNNRYLAQADGTTLDQDTGLIWMSCALGQSHALNCQGAANEIDWTQALASANEIEHLGYRDWRLPSINELRSLVAYNRSRPAINAEVFAHSDGEYWTSSPVSSASQQAWYVDFAQGDDGFDSVAGSAKRVRLVRDSLAAPQEVQAQAGDKQVTVHWQPTPDADGYIVNWSDQDDVSSEQSLGQQVLAANQSHTIVTELANGREYHFVVTAYRGDLRKPSEVVSGKPTSR